MSFQRVAELQTVLEGVSLPATKRELIDYAARVDASFTRDLEALPDREYDHIDDVGEELLPVQPAATPHTPLPKPEIGDSISLEDGRHVQVTGYALDEDGHLSYLVVTEVS